MEYQKHTHILEIKQQITNFSTFYEEKILEKRKTPACRIVVKHCLVEEQHPCSTEHSVQQTCHRWASTPLCLTNTLPNLRGAIELGQYLPISLWEGHMFPSLLNQNGEALPKLCLCLCTGPLQVPAHLNSIRADTVCGSLRKIFSLAWAGHWGKNKHVASRTLEGKRG